jgi:hypothetical protein
MAAFVVDAAQPDEMRSASATHAIRFVRRKEYIELRFQRQPTLREIRSSSYLSMVAWISERDASALLEIVSTGASDSGTEPFPSTVLSALARLIPSDVFVGYEEADFGGGFRIVEEVDVVGEDGKQNAEIAQLLFISQQTVRKHVENIFEKLDVRTRTAAVAALNQV